MNKPTKEYLDFLKINRNYSDRTIASYSEDIDIFFRFLLKEGILMDEVDFAIIRNFLSEELEKGVSKRSCNRRISCLKGFYNFLLKQKYVNDNPFVYISSPRSDKKLPKVLYYEQIEKLFEENDKRTDELAYRDQAILKLLFYSGLRASELIGLDLHMVNLKSRMVRIIGKGNKERIAPFSEDCKKALENYISNLRSKLAAKNPVPTVAVFLNSRGSRLTVRGLEYILDEIEMKIGEFYGLHPHILRHSFASNLLQNGADLRVIQELLGHSSLNATQVYTHVSEATMKKTYLDAHPRAKKENN